MVAPGSRPRKCALSRSWPVIGGKSTAVVAERPPAIRPRFLDERSEWKESASEFADAALRRIVASNRQRRAAEGGRPSHLRLSEQQRRPDATATSRITDAGRWRDADLSLGLIENAKATRRRRNGSEFRASRKIRVAYRPRESTETAVNGGIEWKLSAAAGDIFNSSR